MARRMLPGLRGDRQRQDLSSASPAIAAAANRSLPLAASPPVADPPTPPKPYRVPSETEIKRAAEQLAEQMLRKSLGDDYQHSVFAGGQLAREQVSLHGLTQRLQEKLLPKSPSGDDLKAIFTSYGRSFIVPEDSLRSLQNSLHSSFSVPVGGATIPQLCQLLVEADPESVEHSYAAGTKALNTTLSYLFRPYKVVVGNLQRDTVEREVALPLLRHLIAQVAPALEQKVGTHNSKAVEFNAAARKQLAARVWQNNERLTLEMVEEEMWRKQIGSSNASSGSTADHPGEAQQSLTVADDVLVREVDTENFESQFAPER